MALNMFRGRKLLGSFLFYVEDHTWESLSYKRGQGAVVKRFKSQWIGI